MITQRGTNELHGTAFYFGRNDFFNANSWSNNRTGNPARGCTSIASAAASVDRSISQRSITTRTARSFSSSAPPSARIFSMWISRTVHTEAARNGIFQYLHRNNNVQSVNLLSLSPRHLGLNRFTQSLIGATPQPVAGGPYTIDPSVGDGLNTLGIGYGVAGSDPDKQYDMRIDHKVSESSRWGTHWLDAEWHWEHSTTTPGSDPQFPKGVSPTCFGFVCNSTDTDISKGGLFSMGLNSTFGASAYNELRLGFNRPAITFLPPGAADFLRIQTRHVSGPACSLLIGRPDILRASLT